MADVERQLASARSKLDQLRSEQVRWPWRHDTNRQKLELVNSLGQVSVTMFSRPAYPAARPLFPSVSTHTNEDSGGNAFVPVFFSGWFSPPPQVIASCFAALFPRTFWQRPSRGGLFC